MCGTCGCKDPELVPVELHERIVASNDTAADHLREHFLEDRLLAVNLMGSPGSGKTAVLEALGHALGGNVRLAAVAGDLETDRDAVRLRKAGIPTAMVTTGNACHLDAKMVHHAIHELGCREPGEAPDVLFVENVGNLVCPALWDLGEELRIVALSVTEGEDKPLKYAAMFRTADLVLLTKMDLLPHLDIDLAAIHDALARVMPEPRTIRFSAKTGEGLEELIAFLEARKFAPKSARRSHDHPHAHA